MKLEDILGEAYTEGMSIDDINAALADKKLVDLSSGNYVDKNKYQSKIKELQDTIDKQNEDINNRMTEEEKKNNAQLENQKKFDALQKLCDEQRLELNKMRVASHTRSVQDLLEIKDTDDEYNNFVSAVSKNDNESAENIASYIEKIAKAAYEKGKKESVRKGMSDMGKQNGNGSESGKNILGTELAKTVIDKKSQSYSYFGKYNK